MTPDVYAALKEFLIGDLNGVMTYYGMAATKRMAAQKLWGEDKFYIVAQNPVQVKQNGNVYHREQRPGVNYVKNKATGEPVTVVPDSVVNRYVDAGLSEQEANSPTAKLKLELMEAYRDGHIDKEAYDRARNQVLESYFGRLGADVDPAWKRFSSLMVVYQNVRVLAFATLSSLKLLKTMF